MVYHNPLLPIKRVQNFHSVMLSQRHLYFLIFVIFLFQLYFHRTLQNLQFLNDPLKHSNYVFLLHHRRYLNELMDFVLKLLQKHVTYHHKLFHLKVFPLLLLDLYQTLHLHDPLYQYTKVSIHIVVPLDTLYRIH